MEKGNQSIGQLVNQSMEVRIDGLEDWGIDGLEKEISQLVNERGC